MIGLFVEECGFGIELIDFSGLGLVMRELML